VRAINLKKNGKCDVTLRLQSGSFLTQEYFSEIKKDRIQFLFSRYLVKKLSNVIETLKSNPEFFHIFLKAWNGKKSLG